MEGRPFEDQRHGPPRQLSIKDGQWHLNGEITYRGSRAEGLLMNARMVNATFEDAMRPEFDPEANANEFIAQISDYMASGVRAFTLNLQGGMPGYEGAVNSAFNPDGSLRETYLIRVRRVIEACDQNGAAVILGCFYQRQDRGRCPPLPPERERGNSISSSSGISPGRRRWIGSGSASSSGPASGPLRAATMPPGELAEAVLRAFRRAAEGLGRR